MGTHPSNPSLLKSNREITLLNHIKNNNDKNIPYLFKILSVKSSLSIQIHPDKHIGKIL